MKSSGFVQLLDFMDSFIAKEGVPHNADNSGAEHR